MAPVSSIAKKPGLLCLRTAALVFVTGILFFASREASAISCFDKILARSPFRTPEAVSGFDVKRFHRAREAYAALKSRQHFRTPKSFEERLAFFEAMSRGYLEIEAGISDPGVLRAYHSALKKDKFSMSPEKLRALSDVLFLARQKQKEPLRSMLNVSHQMSRVKRRMQNAERDSLKMLAARELVAEGGAKFLPHKLSREANFFEALGKYGKYSDLREGSLNLAGNGLMLASDINILNLPSISFLPRRRLSSDLLESLKSSDFETNYPRLAKEYGGDARFDRTWPWVQGGWGTLLAGGWLYQQNKVHKLEDIEKEQNKAVDKIIADRTARAIHEQLSEMKIDVRAERMQAWDDTYAEYFKAKHGGRDFSKATPAEIKAHDALRAFQYSEVYGTEYVAPK